ncbi:MAG: hypothetical protein P8M32_03795 [Phycisphaerales bacterium]|nr:hypothetical protein [Phycisphaerales bacterium]
MHSLRHGLAQRFIVLLLAAVMPLCCCLVKSIAATTDASTTAVVSCCSDATQDRETDQAPEQDSCCKCCCIKAPTYTNTWAPPTDEIGLELPPLTTTIALQCESIVHDLVPHVHMHTRSAPPGPWGCAAPPLRHMTILQV